MVSRATDREMESIFFFNKNYVKYDKKFGRKQKYLKAITVRELKNPTNRTSIDDYLCIT